jgi:hypothetical protein
MTIENKRILGNVHSNHTFKLKDGSSIKSLKELYTALRSMEHEVFRHHCNDGRNDFGNWIKDVHKDYKLANSLFSSKSKEESMKVVGSRIYELEMTVAPPHHSIAIRPAAAPAPVPQPKPQMKRKMKPAAKTLEKKASIAAKPKPSANVKSDVEIAKERLEKILIDSVKQKMDRIALEKARQSREKERIEPEFKLEEKVHQPTANEILSEISTERPSMKVEKDPCEEMLKFTEVKSFPRQLKEEMSTVFTRSSMSEFKSDMKKLFSIEGNQGSAVKRSPDSPQPPQPRTATPAPSVPTSGDVDKEEVLSHLKKVFK